MGLRSSVGGGSQSLGATDVKEQHVSMDTKLHDDVDDDDFGLKVV
jgi:hypothetical protein